MHTKVTDLQFYIWEVILTSQVIVSLWSLRRRNTAVAIYLGVEALNLAIPFAVGRLASVHVYWIAYWIATIVDYAAQAYLVVAIFSCIRKTGIPSKNHPACLQGMAMLLLAVSILTLRFPLENIARPAVLWFYAVDHVAFYWLCLMLVVAPLYAYMVDAAKDKRLLLVYLGFALNTAVHAGVIDYAISTHLIHRMRHVPDIAYLVSLVVWFASSYFPAASHQWDPAKTEFLKTALRTKRSHLHELSRHERSLSS